MSAITSTVPAKLNRLIVPLVADKAVETWFGVGACPATQLSSDALGLVLSVGQTVKKLGAVGLTTVTFMITPVALVGIVQLPLVPQTVLA